MVSDLAQERQLEVCLAVLPAGGHAVAFTARHTGKSHPVLSRLRSSDEPLEFQMRRSQWRRRTDSLTQFASKYDDGDLFSGR